MTNREDDSFYSLGFTTPEQMDDIREDHPHPSRRLRRLGRATRSYSVTDSENDRDHAESMAALPRDFKDEPYDGPPMDNPILVAHIEARRSMTQRWADELGADSPEYQRRVAAYNRKHPLPGFDQQKGA